MRIEVFADFICPWCYVGLARLQQALAARSGCGLQVVWLPFELNSSMPLAGRNRREYLIERFGRPDPFADGQRQLLAIGAELGIDFRFDAIERAPNTRRAHALTAAAGDHSAVLQGEVVRRLFAAYFTEGRDIGDPDVLRAIGIAAGMDDALIAAALDDPQRHAAIEQLEALAQRSQISGVPTFVFDRRRGFSGAQPLALFLQVIDELAAPAR